MKKLLLLLAFLAMPVTTLAQVVTAKGSATVNYAGAITPRGKEQAYKAAQLSSIERYFAELGEAESEIFDANKGEIAAALDTYLFNTVVLNEQDQASLSKYSIAVRTEINVASLRKVLRAGTEAGKAHAGPKSPIVYLFVAREAAAVKSFDARVVQRQDVAAKGRVKVDTVDNGREGEAISGSSVATSASRKRAASIDGNSSVTVTTGGSSTQKTDEMSYRVLSMANYKTSVTSVFSQSGFEVADPDFVLSDENVKSVNLDYSKGNDLTAATLRGVVQTLRKANVPLLVLATFDVGVPMEDPVTGQRRVAVTVTGRVLDLKNGLPREVASVPAVQFFAIGLDNTVASTKALKDAALAATKEIVSRLNVAGVR